MAEISVTLDIKDESNAAGRWYAMQCRIFRQNRKALIYAVAHGYVIHVICETESGEQGYIEIKTPRELRQIFHRVPFIPRLRIYKDHTSYVIRKGKVVGHRVWPQAKELIDKYEREYEQRNDRSGNKD